MPDASLPKITLEITSPDRPTEIREVVAERAILGRESGDVILQDPEASALHAEIDCSHGHVIVRDLGSRNGTLRDGQRESQFALHEGQSFVCGATQIRLVGVEGLSVTFGGATKMVHRDDLDPQSSSGILDAKGGRPDDTVFSSDEVDVDDVSADERPQPVNLAAGEPDDDVTRQFDAKDRLDDADEYIAAIAAAKAQKSPSPPAETMDHNELEPGRGRTMIVPRPTAPGASMTPPAPPSALPPEPGTNENESPPPNRTTLIVEGPPVATPYDPTTPVHVDTPSDLGPADPDPEGFAGVSKTVIAPPPPAAEIGMAPAPAPTEASPYGEAVPPLDPGPAFRPAPSPMMGFVDPGPPTGGPQAAAHKSGGGVMRWVTLAVIVLALLGGIGWSMWDRSSPRYVDFAQVIARDLPDDTLAMIGLESPNAVIEMFGELPQEAHETIAKSLGLDPLERSSWEGMGIDPDAPVGIGMLDSDVVVVTVGVSNASTFTESLQMRVQATLGPEAQFTEQSYQGLSGRWMAEPIPVATFIRGHRATILTGSSTQAVARQALEVAGAEQGRFLYDRSGFTGLQKPKADPVSVVYLNTAKLLEEGTWEGQLQAAALLSDVEAIVATLAGDGPNVSLTTQLVVDDSDGLVLSDLSRSTAAFDQIPAPARAGFEFQVNPKSLRDAILKLLSAGDDTGEIRKQIQDQLGIAIEDLVGVLNGRLGYALVGPGSAKSHNAIMWASVDDEAAATELLSNMFDHYKDESGFSSREVSSHTVFENKSGPTPVSAFVAKEHLWLVKGINAEAIIDGPSKSASADNSSIAEAVSDGGQIAGFVDVAGVVKDLGDVGGLGIPGLNQVNFVTARGEMKGRSLVIDTRLSTEYEAALPVFLAGMSQSAPFLIASVTSMNLSPRQVQCQDVADHITDVAQSTLTNAGIGADYRSFQTTILNNCLSGDISSEQLRCYREATNAKDLLTCDSL